MIVVHGDAPEPLMLAFIPRAAIATFFGVCATVAIFINIHTEHRGFNAAAIAHGVVELNHAGVDSGHEKPSMPRVRGDSLVVTPILRHETRFFLNNLLNYFFFA